MMMRYLDETLAAFRSPWADCLRETGRLWTPFTQLILGLSEEGRMQDLVEGVWLQLV